MTLALLLSATGERIACVRLKAADPIVDFLDQLFALTDERTLGGWRIYRSL